MADVPGEHLARMSLSAPITISSERADASHPGGRTIANGTEVYDEAFNDEVFNPPISDSVWCRRGDVAAGRHHRG